MEAGERVRVRGWIRALTRPDGLRRSAVYLEDLESLRGVAIALVFAYHYESCILANMPGVWVSPPRAFVSAGHSGVSLFFILSAFLLSRPFLAEVSRGRPVPRRLYYLRRALRILPLYYGAILVAVLLRGHQAGALDTAALSALFLNQFGSVEPLLPYSAVWWSLATEAQFYLILPLLPLLLGSRQGRVVGAALLLLGTLAYAGLVTGRLYWRDGYWFLVYGVLGRAPLFACGIALAWLYERHGGDERWRVPLPDLVLLGVLLLLGLLLRWVTYVGWIVADGAHLWWHVPEGLLWSAVVWLVLTSRLRLRPLLSNAGLRVLGILSYSIYMWHFPLMDTGLLALRARTGDLYLGWNGATLGALVAISLATLLLSVATYFLVERPFLMRKARLDG